MDTIMPEKPTYEELEQRVKKLEDEAINFKFVEKKLQEQDKHLQSILESADGFAIYRLVVDKDDPSLLTATFASPSIKDVLGHNPDSFSSKAFFSNIHQDDLERVERANLEAFNTNRFNEIFRYYHLKKGQWNWIHAISTGVINDEGQISYVNGIFIDITEQKKAEETLRESEEHLRSLTKSASNFAVYRLSHDKTNPHLLKVVFVSPSVEEILGIDEPMKFETWFLNMHPDDVERITIANQKAFETMRFDEEYRTWDKNKKEWRWIHAISTGTTDEENWTGYVNGILLDITDRKQAEEALRKSDKQYQLIVENISDVVWTMDMNFHNTYVSPSIYQQRGYTPEEVKNQSLSERISPDSIGKVINLYSEKLKLIEAAILKDGNQLNLKLNNLVRMTLQFGPETPLESCQTPINNQQAFLEQLMT